MDIFEPGVDNRTGMTNEDKAQRAIALKAVGDVVKKMADSGASPMEQQVFAQGARREIARQKPDKAKHELATDAARRYKEYNTGGTEIY